ncbi:MAG: hypothetical protein ABGW91_13745 [Christiangramia sp.]|nr:hypothetical protein [Christiangramia sp.]
MKKLILLLFVGLVACNSAKKATSNPNAKFTVENLGSLNAMEISQRYADANIEEGSEMYEEGTVERAYTILYPGTEDELHITWEDRGKSKIHDIRFSGNGQWKSDTGIDIGTTYTELTKMNGKDISFYGFGWDYSGAVLWNGGKLEKSGLRVFLSPENEPGNKYYGDHIIKASPGEIESMNLKVSSIMINYSI